MGTVLPVVRLTGRNLIAHKARFLLTVFAVTIGVGFVSGSFILTDSLKDVFTKLIREINGGIDAQVRTKVAFGTGGSAGAQRNPVPASVLPVVQAVPGVAHAEGSVQQATLTIIGTDGKVKRPTGAPTIGVNWSSDEASPLRIVTGKAPTSASDVALDERAARRSDLKVGDRVGIQLPSGRENFTLTGTFRFGSANSLGGAYLVAFEPATALRLLVSGVTV